ncbi:MAG: hypothetical protein QOI66_1797 [Myxococcales bacterium]|jgi:hypothetical protein|nr:hypothetical protein [Myxococcales bacterium]
MIVASRDNDGLHSHALAWFVAVFIATINPSVSRAENDPVPPASFLDKAVSLTRDDHFAIFAGAIVEGPSRWTLRPVVEGFVERETSGATEVSGLAGAIARLSGSLSVDAALRLSHLGDRASTQVAWEARAGLAWAFEVMSRSAS